MSKYNIDKILQSGSYGDVFTCKNNYSKKQYACKRYMKDKHHYARDEYYTINDCYHKNIVKVKDLVFKDGYFFMIMELCEMDLFDYISENKISSHMIKDFTLQICNALSYLHHKMNVVHRDVKLENVLVKGGTLKLCDFNFAEKYSKTEKKRFKTLGTPDYMCPELLVWNNVKKMHGPEMDIWSVGVIFYILVTDELPFDLYRKKLITKKNFKRDMLPTRAYENVLFECFSKNRRDIKDVIKEVQKIKTSSSLLSLDFRVPKLLTKYRRTRSIPSHYNKVCNTI